MTILVLGGRGKTAIRLAPLLEEANIPFLLASRSTSSSCPYPQSHFDWEDEATHQTPFTQALSKNYGNITAAYIVAPPVLDIIPRVIKFIDFARAEGVKRFVFVSASILNKGDEHMGQVHEYLASLDGTIEWVVLRPTWFMGIVSFYFQSLFDPSTDNVVTRKLFRRPTVCQFYQKHPEILHMCWRWQNAFCIFGRRRSRRLSSFNRRSATQHWPYPTRAWDLISWSGTVRDTLKSIYLLIKAAGRHNSHPSSSWAYHSCQYPARCPDQVSNWWHRNGCRICTVHSNDGRDHCQNWLGGSTQQCDWDIDRCATSKIWRLCPGFQTLLDLSLHSWMLSSLSNSFML